MSQNPFLRYAKKVDWVIWAACLGLAFLSLVLILGLLRSEHSSSLGLRSGNLSTQAVATVIGILTALTISHIPHKIITELWKFYVPAAYLFFISSFIFGAATAARPEARRWIIIPGINMSVQPSEILKLAFILSFALHIYKVHHQLNRPKNLILLCIHGMIPVLLVQLQGDSGMALMFLCVFVCMMFAAGLKWRYFAAASAAAVIMIPIMWTFVLSPMQQKRILTVLNPSELDIQGTYNQQYYTFLAISSGRLTGNGLFGEHIYVPEMHNDFIFAFLGSAFGFLGCIAVLLILLTLSIKILINSANAKDIRGQVICAGVFGMIFFQSAINIAMCLSFLPVIGNSLPFLSCGGSSMVTSFVGVGLVLSVYRHTQKKKKIPSTFLPGGN
ncbi:MAG: FtsW/RodA/SpoVE family cell cycle protein [Oscillospiraceae bacterium]|nr:FtsW/RodA/SpoVE family cell cycle protein [Oscillospiraceae bacterium]